MKTALKSIVVSLLTAEAKLLLRRTKPKIIAVTGSVGKTSTKDAIYAAIKNHVHARKSEKSFNSEIGVPLSVLGLENGWNNPFIWIKNLIEGLFIALLPGHYPEVLVLEAGVDRPGDMSRLTAWLRPDIVVLTRLPDIPVHVEYFERPEDVVAEKMQLVHALKPDGVLIYNHDDTIIQSVLETVRHQAFGYSRFLQSHFTLSDDKIVYKDDRPIGLSTVIAHFDESVTVKLTGVIGLEQVYVLGAAAAVAAQLDIPLVELSAAFTDYVPPPGRMRVIDGIKGTLIIDDTYNASPVAAESALETLNELKGAKRKIAVMGDMLELGRYSVREHERIGELAARSTDILLTVGVRARKIAEGALEHGLSEKHIYQYDLVERCGKELQTLLQPGDVVLIKASQGMRAERIVEEIMAEPDLAPELLVRQGRAWLER